MTPSIPTTVQQAQKTPTNPKKASTISQNCRNRDAKRNPRKNVYTIHKSGKKGGTQKERETERQNSRFHVLE